MLIEDRFGKQAPTAVPQEIRDLSLKGKVFLQEIYDRVFRWWNFFQYQSEDKYIHVVKKAFDEHFRGEYPHEKIGGTKYKKSCLAFLESLALSCKFVNDELAHLMSLKGPQLISSGFDNAIDADVILFYNSLLGTDIAKNKKDVKAIVEVSTQKWTVIDSDEIPTIKCSRKNKKSKGK